MDPDTNIPRPDPTDKTTEALRRDVLGLRELLEAKIESIRGEISEIVRIKEQKFQLVKEQFEAVDRARLEHKADFSKNLETALTTQKELALEIKQAFTKQIDSLSANTETKFQSALSKISDIEVRMGNREGATGGMDKLWAFIVGLIGIVAVLWSIYNSKNTQPAPYQIVYPSPAPAAVAK
jgi:hypothetical protein